MAEPDWSTALYSPLPLCGTQLRTRFLRILKGSGKERLRCKLFTSTLVSTEYEALSYTWGTDAQINPVSVNGIITGVTENLQAALLALRKPTRSRVIWVDALCINQADVRERSHQVQQMGDMYRCAHRVVVWVGAASDDSDELFHLMRKPLNDHPSQVDHLLGAERRSDASVDWQSMTREKLAIESGNVEQMIDRLVGRRYWTRIWIVQEIAQAKSDSIVICGNESIEWSRLLEYATTTHGMQHIKLLQAIRARARTPPRLRLNGDQIPRPSEVRASYENDLFYFLDRTREFDATDPRDKVFALLSMTRGLSAQVSIADYDQSVERVFTDLAVTAMNRSSSLDITSYKAAANPSDLESATLALPLWVPDFSKKGLWLGPVFEGADASQYRSVNLCGIDRKWLEICSPTADATLFFRNSLDRRILHVPGLCLARVKSTATTKGVPAQVTHLSGASNLAVHQSRNFSWKQYIKEQYQAHMQSRYTRWMFKRSGTSVNQMETSINTSVSRDETHIAEALFLFHARIHKENTICGSTAVASPCTRALLLSTLGQELDLVKFLRTRYLIDEATKQVQDIDTGHCHFVMSSLFDKALKAAKPRRVSGHGGGGHLLDWISNDLSEFRGLYSSKKLTEEELESCVESLDFPHGPCPWPPDGSCGTEALGRVPSCDHFLDDIMQFRMLETDAGYLGFVNDDLEIQPNDQIVLFKDTARLKVLRSLPSDRAQREELRFVLCLWVNDACICVGLKKCLSSSETCISIGLMSSHIWMR